MAVKKSCDLKELENDMCQVIDESEDMEQIKAKSIYVPKVQNMDNYLLKHYKSRILQDLNEQLVNNRIQELICKPVKSDRITAGECVFRHFNYWRINQTDLWIQIDLRMELRVETTDGIDTDFYWFSVQLWFSFAGDEEECSFESICLLEDKQDFGDCWKLDKYLVPILRRDEIDNYSEKIWEAYDPAAAKDGKLRNAKDLAKKMGLSLAFHRLYKQSNTKAMILFHDACIQIQPEQPSGERELPPPQEVPVKANTIILNTNSQHLYDQALTIYHECIHFEWHYMFYRLQNMHNNDIHQLKKVRRATIKGQDAADPTEFMEQHAKLGSYGLMMPVTFMRETIDKMYKEACSNSRKDGYYDHDGRRYDFIARSIASEFNLHKASVRARMLQLGYKAAQGALNYADGRYIEPFAFSDLDHTNGNKTYVIDRKNIAMLYNKDKAFQKIMQSGLFAYVDGHVVFCDSANIIQACDGVRLSAWANAHIDRVSLRFSKIYTDDHKHTYTFGQMNNDEALKNSFKFLDISGSMTLKEAERAKNQLMEEMPLSFHSALAYIMKGRTTVDELVKRIPISRRTLLRLRTEERKSYKLDQIIALCIGLHLPPWLSEVLLDKAGLSVKRYGPYGYYGTILDCFYMDTIQDVQKYLSNNGYEPLGLCFED